MRCSASLLRATPRLVFFALTPLLLAAPSLAERAAPERPYFVDIAEASGLVFDNYDGQTGSLQFPEMMTSGAALFDCDGDGDLDAYTVQGGHLMPDVASDALTPPPAGPLRDRLWRNDGPARPGEPPRFVDITERSGIDARGYGMAATVGDFDGDGANDLFVSNFGADQLWRGRGDGTFETATRRSGIEAGTAWSVGAVAFDDEADGDLDLFVLGYVEYDAVKNPKCFASNSRRDYCGPSAFVGATNRLWRNRGDGTFVDATRAAGLDVEPRASLGAVAADWNGDGRLDLYVANDGQANRLWLAQADGTFLDEAPLAGVAVDGRGLAEAGMGIAVGDVDQDADLDLLVTHLDGETHTLYLAQDGAFFLDRSAAWGLAASTPWTSFGTAFLDADGDGRLDLYVASGAVRREHGRPAAAAGSAAAASGASHALAQADQLYLQRGGRWVDASDAAGPAVVRPTASRAAAFGDIDDDGDLDVLLVDTGGRARLLSSTLDQRLGKDHWIGLRLLDGQRDALGARVELQTAHAAVARVATDGSYGAANDPRVLFRFGTPPEVRGVLVHWVGGEIERFPAPPRGAYTVLRRGKGKSPATDKPASGNASGNTSGNAP